MSRSNEPAPEDIIEDPCLNTSISPRPIPKPSQVLFRPLEKPCTERDPRYRLLVIRSSNRFTFDRDDYLLLTWCRPADDSDSDWETLPELNDFCIVQPHEIRKGRARGIANDIPVVIHWQAVRHSQLLERMCDVLTSEYRREPCRPLELYTSVLKFASVYCDLFSNVQGLTWAQNYQNQIIHLDQLSSAFSASILSAHREYQKLSSTWTDYSDREVTGHASLPPQWMNPSSLVHIAADASYNSRTGGAYAYVSSMGNYYASPTPGKSVLCCELTAIAQAVAHAQEYSGRVVVWSDSRMALRHIARIDQPPSPTLRPGNLAALDLIRSELKKRAAAGKGELVFRWIKAHTDCSSLQRILNDGADRLARHTMRNICQGSFTDTLAGVCSAIVEDCMNNLAAITPSALCDPAVTLDDNVMDEALDDTDSRS